MAGLPLYGPLAAPPALLRCILYCEFDPHKGPRPVFQAPQSYVSNEVCEVVFPRMSFTAAVLYPVWIDVQMISHQVLSDHLIASSELCGRIISVAAFGLRFVG